MTDVSAPLGEIATIERDGIDPQSVDPATPYVGLEHISGDGTLTNVLTTGEANLASTKFRFGPHHILFGKLRPYLRKVVRPNFAGICSTDIIPIAPSNRIDRNYLFHYLRTDAVINLATSMASGANLPRINPKLLSDFAIPVPPLKEQRRIAAILDQGSALCKLARSALYRCSSLDIALFEKLLVKTEEIGNSERLGNLVDAVTVGHVGPTSEFFRESGVPFLRTGNVGDEDIDLTELKYVSEEFHVSHKKSRIGTGDVLVSRVISDRVRAAIVPSVLKEANCANVVIVRPGRKISGEYLVRFIRSPAAQRALLRRQVGSAQTVVNTKVMAELMVPVPSASDQGSFNRAIKNIGRLRTALTSRLKRLDDLFLSLQSRLFEEAKS